MTHWEGAEKMVKVLKNIYYSETAGLYCIQCAPFSPKNQLLELGVYILSEEIQ